MRLHVCSFERHGTLVGRGALLVLLALGTVACGGTERDGGRDASVSLTPCVDSGGCGGGEVCRAGFCRTWCSDATDCSAPLGVCDPALDYCVACTTTSDCGTNQTCTSNACTFYCGADTACAADEYCVTETGACAPRECATTSECSGGFTCTQYVCTPIDPIICDAGSESCSGGNTVVLRCSGDGTMEAMETCLSGSVCVVDGTSASCAPVVCTADQIGCTSDFTAYACNATGTVRTETPCGTGEYCGAGVCTTQACVPANVRCSLTGVREVCDARGALYETAPCAVTEGCRDGSCLARICTPAAGRCVPGTLTGREVCDAEGLAYVAAPCAGTESCSAGACLTRVCVPSAPSCDGSGSHVCNADGLGYGTTTSCPMSTSCSAGTGLCGAWLCTPSSASCLAGSNTRRACNADGLGYTDTVCGASTTCSAGLCAAWMCTPGALSCLDSNTRRVCNADGLGYSSASCTGSATYGYACTGAGACTDRICIPGSASSVCASTTTRQVCNTDGLGFSASACASGQSCLTGTCAVRCGDGIVGASETCDDGNTTGGDGCSSTCASEACGAVSFDGVDDRIAFSGLSLGDTNWTLEAWVWRQTDVDWAGSIASFGPAGGGFAMVTYWSSGTTYDGQLAVQRAGLWNRNAASFVSSSGWHHVAVTHTAGGGTAAAAFVFFVDGAKGATGLASGTPSGVFPSPSGGYIGAEIGSFSGYFRGLIDEVRVSNAVRYSSNFVPAQSMAVDVSTAALWRFEEGAGTSAADSGASGYTGTLQGGVTWVSVPACTH